MKKLNNKGITLFELIVCFIIVAAIVLSMFSLILKLQTDESIEDLKSDVINYKNNMTQLIQNDIINGELKKVKLEKEKTSDETIYKFKLYYKKHLKYNVNKTTTKDYIPTSNDINNICNDRYGTEANLNAFNDPDCKVLEIHASEKNNTKNYILYSDINSSGVKQNIKYPVPNMIGDNCTNNGNCNQTRFTSIYTNINGSESEGWGTNRFDPVTGSNIGTNVFNLDVTIGNSNLGGDYHIKIIAPLNYSYCIATN